MSERSLFRLEDMKRSIGNIRLLLDGKTFEAMYDDAVARAAYERFLEILSEASRHIPQEWKDASGTSVPWRQVADLGNHIRHAYHKLDAQILWNVYEKELDILEHAVDEMLRRYSPAPQTD